MKLLLTDFTAAARGEPSLTARGYIPRLEAALLARGHASECPGLPDCDCPLLVLRTKPGPSWRPAPKADRQ